jgi:signal transduction histidine kinase
MKLIIPPLILISFFAFNRPAYAQNDMFRSQMDSLAKVLSHQKTTRDSILILQKLVDQSPIPLNETAHYPNYIGKLLALNQKEKLINPAPYEILEKGIDYWQIKQYAKALTAIQASVTEFDKQHKSMIPLLFNMRFLYNFLNDQDDRLSYYRQKLEYYQLNGPVENTGPCYHAIAGYYLFKGAYNQSIENYLKSAELAKVYSFLMYPPILSVIGSTYDVWGNDERAAYYLEKSLQLQAANHTDYALELTYLSLADIAYRERNYKRALQMVNTCITSVKEGRSQRLASGLVFKAAIYLKINKADSAFILLNIVKAMSDTIAIKTVSANGFMEINYDYYKYSAIAGDIKENQRKISMHGKRADFIVKGMLLHSRTSTGEKELTNINTMADEFFKLSYQGLRAKDKDFNAELVTNFDKELPEVNVAHQDIGRVLLNMFNNAFYALNQKQKTAGPDYKPEVSVSISIEKNNLIIKVKDNGSGIPDAVKDKIMQPFFTTKPTGEGTGLGLSLSYDIVVKGHGGSITVDTKENEFTEFIITLPIS